MFPVNCSVRVMYGNVVYRVLNCEACFYTDDDVEYASGAYEADWLRIVAMRNGKLFLLQDGADEFKFLDD